ncbi:nucleotide sugar dehydrogenase [Sphingomonas kyeonggiensis]|uniref:UDP-N-acetyl-D-glucosamine dehydrogenase n=1 Tax=Sphingomonas kyeonggiensis TaxID=1268553 RepID=A0A7W6JP15_9SPHN|nr:nucleotide sugar dehydrogenase [Sphingomonas kyeonggiensis]MBB4096927.1 UDP-N-acetyl-D-glucosamine dehydrogenase [Sphingomonas kyeonggiensis]
MSIEWPAHGLKLQARIESGSAIIGVIGMGYVGLPLAVAFGEAGCPVLAFDVDQAKIDALEAGESYIKHIDAARIAPLVANEKLRATADLARLGEADVVLICVPTPLTRHLEPDLKYVELTTQAIAKTLRRGQLVILESTTYPGTTREVMQPILEAEGLVAGKDFFLAYSPEREDPGNPTFSTTKIPKVVGADDTVSADLALGVYRHIVPQAIQVSSAATAEAVKITENVFRAVNIALVNELKLIFTAMDIDVWEVIDAAKSKPFGFMPFYPGPGLGGHCIPIDPFYLTWKAREYNQHTKFIELAGQINADMPQHVVRVLADTMDARFGRGLRDARILVLGVAYKKNVEDIRESPSLRLMEMIEARGATADFFDPHVAQIDNTREHPTLNFRDGIAWDEAEIARYDAVLIATDHDAVDYAALVEAAKLVVDTRNACAKAGVVSDKVVRA